MRRRRLGRRGDDGITVERKPSTADAFTAQVTTGLALYGARVVVSGCVRELRGDAVGVYSHVEHERIITEHRWAR